MNEEILYTAELEEEVMDLVMDEEEIIELEIGETIDLSYVSISAERLATDDGAKITMTTAEGKVAFVLYDGKQGERGPQGYNGAQGTKGDPGPVGPAGPAGPAGTNGQSAYALACEYGFVGTPQEWLESLRGEEYELTQEDLDKITDEVLKAENLLVEAYPVAEEVYI